MTIVLVGRGVADPLHSSSAALNLISWEASDAYGPVLAGSFPWTSQSLELDEEVWRCTACQGPLTGELSQPCEPSLTCGVSF